MKTLKDVKVGDEIYVIPRDTRDKPYNATVEKVGRKHIHIKYGLKFDIETGDRIEPRGYSSREYAYYSKEEYENWIEQCDQKKLLISSIESLIRDKDIEQLNKIQKFIMNC